MTTAAVPACSVEKEIRLREGTAADFRALAAFHYRSHHPGPVTKVYAIDHVKACPETVAVLVVSLPALHCTLRDVATGGRYHVPSRALAAALLNREVRTISRVVVRPDFRSLGLAVKLVRRALACAETPYTEALAAMGRVHPFFQAAGMTAYDRPADEKTTRLLAALEHAGLTPFDLCHPPTCHARLAALPAPGRAFVIHELHRYAGAQLQHLPPTPHERPDVLNALVAFARSKLLSQPVYYLYRTPL